MLGGWMLLDVLLMMANEISAASFFRSDETMCLSLFCATDISTTACPPLHSLRIINSLTRRLCLSTFALATTPSRLHWYHTVHYTTTMPSKTKHKHQCNQAGRGRGQGGRHSNDPSRRISHALSWVLRHKALELGLPVSKDGYVPIDSLLKHSHPRLQGLTLEQIQNVVKTNDKQRFKLEEKTAGDFSGAALQLEEPFLCIRANQGHSVHGIDSHALLQPISPEELATIPTIIHGTYSGPWEAIQKMGLSKMGRHHIHFASGLLGEDGVISGMRKSCDVYIYVDPVKCAKDHINFFRSDNGVLLSAGVNDEGILPMTYVSHVTDNKGNILLDQRVDA